MTGTAGPAAPRTDSLERSIARLLTIGTYVSVVLLAVGVLLMMTAGIDPLSGGPPFHAATLVDDLVHLRPVAFIWLGLVAVVATPASRVVASLVGYARRGERTMAIVAVLILTVIAMSVIVGWGFEA